MLYAISKIIEAKGITVVQNKLELQMVYIRLVEESKRLGAGGLRIIEIIEREMVEEENMEVNEENCKFEYY